MANLIQLILFAALFIEFLSASGRGKGMTRQKTTKVDARNEPSTNSAAVTKKRRAGGRRKGDDLSMWPIFAEGVRAATRLREEVAIKKLMTQITQSSSEDSQIMEVAETPEPQEEEVATPPTVQEAKAPSSLDLWFEALASQYEIPDVLQEDRLAQELFFAAEPTHILNVPFSYFNPFDLPLEDQIRLYYNLD